MNELIYDIMHVYLTNYVIGSLLGLWIALLIWVFTFFRKGVK